jgi:hypothetical protein
MDIDRDAKPLAHFASLETLGPWGWFGAQVGSTLWLLLDGIDRFQDDVTSGLLLTSGFVIANLWGLSVRRFGKHIYAYGAIQRMLGGITIVVASLFLIEHLREAPLPAGYWTLGVYPAMMVWFRVVLKEIPAPAQPDDATDRTKPDR